MGPSSIQNPDYEPAHSGDRSPYTPLPARDIPTAMKRSHELLHSHRNRLPCCRMKTADGATYTTFDLFPSLLSRSFLKFEIMHTIRAQRDGDNHKKKLA